MVKFERLMKLLFFMAIAGALASASWAATPATKPPAKNAASSKASGKPSTKKATSKRSGRKSKRTRAAAPSFQLHPDPERYTQIQHALADRGYFKGESNGQWKDDSSAALRRFQTDQKLPDDGKINALSLSALGLGPKHDGTTASTVPIPAAEASPPTPQAPESGTPPPP